MSTFGIIRNRKPWNQSAKWLLIHATWLAEEANDLGLTTIEEIAARLKQDFEQWCAGAGKDPKRISISTWTGIYCGINQTGSSYDSAFKIFKKSEKEVQNG